jgi:branched-chain amino acid transport system substrate-binding protein
MIRPRVKARSAKKEGAQMKAKLMGVLTIVVAIAVLMAACAPAPTSAPATSAPAQQAPTSTPSAAKPKTYKIGLVNAMTGDMAVWGQSDLKGATIAIEEINAAGGVNGVPLELVVEDNRSTAADTVTAVKKLAEVDKVPVVFGLGGSTLCFAVCPESAKYKMTMLSTSATNPGLGPKCPDYFFRLMSSDAFQGPEWVNVLEYLHKKGVTDQLEAPVMYINNDYGIGVKDAFVGEMNKRGYKVTVEQPFEWNATDFRTEIMKVAATKPKVTFLVGYPKEIGLILKQAKELGFETQWVIDVCAVTKEIPELAGEGAEGAIALYPGKRAGAQWTEYEAKFRKRWGEPPTIWSEFAYDAVKLIAMAIEKGGYDGTAIRDSLREVAENYVGPSGPKKFMPGDNVVYAWYEWDVCKNGQWVMYETE